MSDQPTLGEVMRELERTMAALTDLAKQMKEDREHAASTYVRRDVWVAERKADHAWIRDVVKDVTGLEEEKKTNAAFRKQVSLVAAGGLLGIAGSFGVSLFNLIVGSA